MLNKKIGLVLGSGGAKGLAHIGVIKTLVKNNIKINCLSGSSIGALIGGFYAYFNDIDLIEKIALNIDRKLILSLINPTFKTGLIDVKKIENFLHLYLKNVQFNQLKIQFNVVATNILTGQPVILNRGSVVKAILASIAFPLVFKPIKIKNNLFVDGGLTMPLPVEAIKEFRPDIILAVNLENNYFSRFKNLKNNPSFYKLAQASINIMVKRLSDINKKDVDVLIEPKFKTDIYWDKFLKAKELIKIGEEISISVIKQINKKLLK